MSLIRITDNKGWNDIEPCVNGSLSAEDKKVILEDLSEIADTAIEAMSFDDNPNLLVFPQILGEYGDDIGKGTILSLNGDQISTGNIMGFVGVNNTQVDIRSRFSKEDSFFDTPDMKINFVINGHNYSTGIINDNARPQFNEGFNLNWTVEIGAIKFTGVEVDTTFDDEVFSTSVDASGFKGYERLSGTLYSNGNSLTIRFSPSQSLPVCPW